MKDLKVRTKIIKLLEKNIKYKFCDLGLSKCLLEMTQSTSNQRGKK